LDRVRIADIPAAAIVAQNDLRSPGPAFVLADARPYAEGRQAMAIDADDAAVAHTGDRARRAPFIDARQEAPGQPAILALEHLRPHDAGRVALRAQRAEDASVGQQQSARIEPTMPAKGDAHRS